MFGSVPAFFKRFPSERLPGPCTYCLAADTEFAKLAGASEREINEAVAMAALTRHWSTLLNGMQIDEAAFKRDVERS